MIIQNITPIIKNICNKQGSPCTRFPLSDLPTNKGLKQGCPLSPLLYSLYTSDIDRLLTVQRGAATALDSVQVPHCDYADDIALTSNTAECLQFQLNKFHNYTNFKGLKLNTNKTKVMVFFSKHTHAIPTFTYDGTHTSRTCHSFQMHWIHSHS